MAAAKLSGAAQDPVRPGALVRRRIWAQKSAMKLCALTMVYRDYWALGQWYRHFGALLGPENLYVIAHGPDPDIARLCPGASVWSIPRGDLGGFDRTRGRMLNGFSDGLLQLYDWVIRTDVDELICTEPGLRLHDVLAAQDAPALFALGLNVIELPGDPPLRANVFESRRNAVFTGHYSKAFAVRAPVALMRHGVQVRPRRALRFPFVMPEGLYLAHLKYANRAALEAANLHRMEIARGAGKGLPGAAWRDAEAQAAETYARVQALPMQPWEMARVDAHARLSGDPLRDVKDGLVRARKPRFRTRTMLPPGFGRPPAG